MYLNLKPWIDYVFEQLTLDRLCIWTINQGSTLYLNLKPWIDYVFELITLDRHCILTLNHEL